MVPWGFLGILVPETEPNYLINRLYLKDFFKFGVVVYSQIYSLFIIRVLLGWLIALLKGYQPLPSSSDERPHKKRSVGTLA